MDSKENLSGYLQTDSKQKNMQAMDFEKEIFLKDGLAEITQALFCQEMCRRRCRRKRLKESKTLPFRVADFT